MNVMFRASIANADSIFFFDDTNVVSARAMPDEFAPLFDAIESLSSRFPTGWDLASFGSLLVLQFLSTSHGEQTLDILQSQSCSIQMMKLLLPPSTTAPASIDVAAQS